MKDIRSTICVAALALAMGAPAALAGDVQLGVDDPQGSSFTYQGQLNDAGVDVDGFYDMRFSVFSSSGVQIHSPITYIGVNVVDGLFTIDLDFDESLWSEFGSVEKYLQIEVRANGGGAYTALTPRTRITSAPHANVAQRANALSFPYAESLTGYTSADTAMDLSVNEGTALRLQSSMVSSPAFVVEGDNPFGVAFFDHTALINDLDTNLGLVSVAEQHSLVGYNNSPNGRSAVLAEVGFDATETTAAVFASGIQTTAYLARGDHAGLFSGDVHVDRGEVTRDFAFTPARVGPVAYGFINSAGSIGNATANMSCTWNAATQHYEITLSDHTMSFGNTVAIVSVVDLNQARVATTNVAGSTLFVKIWSLGATNTAIQDNFQIAIFEANNPAALRSPVPAGMDPELYYQQTGAMQPTTPYNEPVEMPEPSSAVRD